MSTDFLRLRLLLATFASWINRDQGQVIAYLVGEKKSRRQKLTDAQRRRLAAKGKILGRRFLEGRDGFDYQRRERAVALSHDRRIQTTS